MGLVVKTRIGKKNTLYIPKAVAEAVGLKEDSTVVMHVRGNKIVVEVIPDPFDLALRHPKFAETSFEELERESEETQDELIRG